MRKRYRGKKSRLLLLTVLVLLLTACSSGGQVTDGKDTARSDTQISRAASQTESQAAEQTESQAASQTESQAASQTESQAETQENAEEEQMTLKIGDTEVPVTWEVNDSVGALRELVREEPLSIQMSMYGGFEQVGPVGQSIVSDDQQTTTGAGDIVLYSGDQIVVFYGSNAWAYTRLGHVDLSQKEMEKLLGNGDIILTLQTGK